ncbi:MAG: hypothetical protein DMG60_11380 [Acidobacteria bacterium]|nr:MAG: hypothetical protein DMG60_11380 [Acidobacteriota bacterium]
MLRKTLSILAALLSTFFVNACNSKHSAQKTTFLPVTMRRFAIEPDVIRVKQGEDVVLVVSTKDVQHGFQIEDMGINEPIQPGKPANIHVDTSKNGNADFRLPLPLHPDHPMASPNDPITRFHL